MNGVGWLDLAIIYHSPLPHTYALSSLHRPPESYRPVTSDPTLYVNPYSHMLCPHPAQVWISICERHQAGGHVARVDSSEHLGICRWAFHQALGGR